MIIKNNETDTGYFRLLDYSNQLAICYSIDDISNCSEIAAESIQNNYLTTIII